MTPPSRTEAAIDHRSEAVHRFLIKPSSAGVNNSVDGGKLLEWIDEVAYAAAARWSGRYCVTAYIGEIHFARTIHVGELVELHASLVYTGRTSMHIVVTVYSSDPTKGALVQTTQCLVIFVAVDEAGAPVEVPQWFPMSDLARQRYEQASLRIPVRKRIEEEMAAQSYTAEGTAPQTTLRFITAPSDVNWGGKVHGGRVMRWIDDAAYVLGSGWARQQVLASYVAGIRFYRPIRVGDVIEVTARIVHTGPRSIHHSVHVTTSSPHGSESRLAAHGLTVFVALDEVGKAHPVPPWRPACEEDRRLDHHAQGLIHLRQEVEPFSTVVEAP